MKRAEVFALGNIVKVINPRGGVAAYMAVENEYKDVKNIGLFLQGLCIDFDNQHWGIEHFDENFVYGDQNIIGYAKADDKIKELIPAIYNAMQKDWKKFWELYDEMKKYVDKHLIEISE